METLVRHLSIVLVFLTVGAFAWLYGGTRSDLFVPTVPWLWAFLMEALLFFPQRKPYEDGVAARQRLWKGLGRDPLLYVTFVLAVILVIPLTNRGLCAVCDYPAIMAGADLEQSIGGIETMFKENADQVIAYANQAYATAGLSANDYMQQVTSFSASLLQAASYPNKMFPSLEPLPVPVVLLVVLAIGGWLGW